MLVQVLWFALSTHDSIHRHADIRRVPRAHPHIERVHDAGYGGRCLLAGCVLSLSRILQGSEKLTTCIAAAAELGSVFYSVKEKNFDERGNRRKADREFSKKAEIETEMARQREE